MESQPNYQHSPWLNMSTSTNQHKEEIPTLSVSGENGKNGPIQAEEKRAYRDALIQPKRPTTGVPPSRTKTVANSSIMAPFVTSKSLIVQASIAKKTTTVTSATTPTISKSVPVKHSVGKEGLTLPLQTMANVGTSECRLKSPSSSRTGERKATAKNSPTYLHKTTSASQISMSTNSPKNLQKTSSAVVISIDSPKSVQQATISQIPRAISSPRLRSTSTALLADERTDTSNKEGSKQGTHSLLSKLRPSTDDRAPTVRNKKQVASLQQRGMEHSMGKSPQRYKEDEGEEKNKKTGGEDILQDMQVEQISKEMDLTLQVASKCPISPPERKQLSPGAIPPSVAHLKADTNVMTQERECVTERRKREEQKREEQEKDRLREKMKEKREEERKREEQEKEEKQKRRGRAEKEKEEARRKETEREQIERERRSERERAEKEREKMAACQTSKSFKDAATMTIEDHALVQIAALQPELVYVDAAVQAAVEVSSKSTFTSPTLTLHYLNRIDFDAINLGKSTETACMRLQNGLSPDDSSHSDRLSSLSLPTVTTLGSKPRFLGPPPYKPQNSQNPPPQHVCQIEIELLSQSSLSESLALPQVTISEVNPTNHSGQVSPVDSKASSIGSGLEGEPMLKIKEADNADKGPPPEVVWDEQGMTWEVYGAAVEMESLGFAIQSHLQKKIREHEQRIGTLRKSISLSEHSQPYGKGANKKKKRNIFRCFFRRSTCCSKMQPKAEAAH